MLVACERTTTGLTAARLLTPNGKLDRRALPSPSAANRLQVAEVHIQPRTEIERTIVMIWQAVLNLESVGIHDNFFG